MPKNAPPLLPPLKEAPRATLAFLRHLQHRIVEDNCLQSAAALTYLSLFALVPLMTVAYAMLSAVPAFANAGEEVQHFLFTHFVPSTGQEIQNYLLKFSNEARQLTGIGVIFLVVTAYGMLSHIERTLNGIWRVPNRRNGVRSFLLYWGILSLGPLFIGLAIGISTYLLSLRVLADGSDILGLKTLLLAIAPMLLTSAAFTLTYIAVPNSRVPLRDAVIGGIAAGIGFEIAKQFFAIAVASGYQRVYGTFAILPLFLVWIYTSWVIVLAGAELVFALSGYAARHSRHVPDLLIAVAVLGRLWQCHLEGRALHPRALVREHWLLGRYPLPTDRWSRLRGQLMQAGLIKTGEDGDYLLGRDLHQMTLWQLAELLGQVPQGYDRPTDDSQVPWLAQYRDALDQWRRSGAEQLDIPLAELFATTHPDHVAADPADGSYHPH
jgi:membrane protein